MFGGIGDWGDWIIMSSKDKKIFFSVLGFPLVLLFVFVTYNIFFGKSGKEWFLKEEAKFFFKGKIVSEYREEDNHNIKVVVLNDGYKYQMMGEWEDLINVGDSISKKKDSLYIIVVKPDGEKLKLDYAEAVKKWRN